MKIRKVKSFLLKQVKKKQKKKIYLNTLFKN